MNKNRCLFFVRLNNPEVIEQISFYKHDLAILRSIDPDTIVCTRIRDIIKFKPKIVFCWWFGWSIFPLFFYKFFYGSKILVTGAVHTQEGGDITAWPFWKRTLMQLTMRLADKTIFISETDRSLAGRRYETHDVVYCGIELHEKRSFKRSYDELKFVTISNLQLDNLKRKGVPDAINLVNILKASGKNVKLDIIGRYGSGYNYVKRLISDLGLEQEVKLLGHVSELDKKRILQESRFYLQLSKHEGFGVAVLEARSQSCIVLAYHENTLKEVNGNNILYFNNLIEISDWISNNENNICLLRNLGKQSSNELEQFDVSVRRSKLLRLLSEQKIEWNE